MYFKIKQSDIPTVVALSQQIPELVKPHPASEYEKRLTNVPHLILVAYQDDQPIGFKVGYYRDESFYSWMGGILPAFRRKGVAKKLADAQEAWAKQQNYHSITFKTRNEHKAMRMFALQNGFDIVDCYLKGSVHEYRIVLRKEI
jgi:ribosomal protein S18 acetylase RimI-like enzyme